MPFLTNDPLPQCLQPSPLTPLFLDQGHRRGSRRYLSNVKCIGAASPRSIPPCSGNFTRLVAGSRRINLLVARLLVHGAVEQRESLAAVDARELARELEREQASTVAFPENGTPTDDSASHGREPSRPVAVGQERTP